MSTLRVVLLVAIFPGVVPAQFRNLVATDDGALLIFSSALRMTGTDQYSWDKLFSIDSAGLKLYAQRQEEGPAPGSGDRLSNYYLMQDAELSGDGSVRALISARVCVILGSGCFIGTSKIQSEVSGLPGQPLLVVAGQMRMSRNGRYAFVCCDGFAGPTPPTILDLTTGSRRVLSNTPSALPRGMVASAGAVILPTEQASLVLATLAESRTFTTSAKTLTAILDDSAATAFYEGQLPAGDKVVSRVDLQNGTERRLATASDLSLVGATSDGRLVALLSDGQLTSAPTGGVPQLFVVQSDGTALRQITQDAAGIVQATLARNGTAAYAVTSAGRLLKIDVVSGAETQLIGRTLTIQTAGTSDTPVAGSAFCVSGTGFADSAAAAAPPLPSSLGGLSMLLDGSPVPLQSVTPEQACFQLPWQTALGDHSLLAQTDSDPQFQAVSTVPLAINNEASLNFLLLGPEYPPSVSLMPYPVAAHQDFSGLVTRANPARPGEILHFYVTGLGPVVPPVASGYPAPANPPAAITSPLSCSFSGLHGGVRGADVLFAGLAPGLAGYYQLSLRLPRDLHLFYGDALLSCAVGAKRAAQSAWIPILVHPCPITRLAQPGDAAGRDCLETRFSASSPF